MTVDSVKRTVAVVACATALSLFTTIASVAAVNVAALKWDGSMCATGTCGTAFAGIARIAPKRIAAIPANRS